MKFPLPKFLITRTPQFLRVLQYGFRTFPIGLQQCYQVVNNLAIEYFGAVEQLLLLAGYKTLLAA